MKQENGSTGVKVDRLPEGAHRKAGEFDKAGRWYPEKSFIVPGTFAVKCPSKAYPASFLNHFYTKVYAHSLALYKPALYFFLTGIAPESEEAKPIIAAHLARRLQKSPRTI